LNYHVLFDEGTRGYREWWFPAMLVCAGAWLVFFRVALVRIDRAVADQIAPQLTPLFAVVLSVGGAGFIFTATYPAHAQIRDALRAGSSQIVEGRVTEVRRGDPGLLQVISQDHRTHEYRYSERRWPPGFGDPYAVIPVGAYVRTAEVNGSIGRLEVAGDST
jgi:hypothetical protein